MIDPDDAALIRGFLVNKFRGDPALFAAGMAEDRGGDRWEPLGLMPFFPDARLLPAEDALALDRTIIEPPRRAPQAARVRIAVPILPHIANFDDLDPLEAEPGVELVRVRPGAALPGDAALVILPGSKATIADLAALRRSGFDIDIAAHLRRGGMVLGLCGGYQMLGRRSHDPNGIEGPAGTAPGLGHLDVETVLADDKRLETVEGKACGAPFLGLRDAYRTNDGAGLRAAVRLPARWFAGGRSLRRWSRIRDLCSRPFPRRSSARRLARTAGRRTIAGRL